MAPQNIIQLTHFLTPFLQINFIPTTASQALQTDMKHIYTDQCQGLRNTHTQPVQAIIVPEAQHFQKQQQKT